MASTASERKPPMTKSAFSRVIARSMALVASGTDWILVAVDADQLDLQLLGAGGDAARLVDLVASHLGARPGVLSLGKRHRPDHGDLDAVLCVGGGRDGEDAGRGDDERTSHGISRLGNDEAKRHLDSAPALRRAPRPALFRTSKSAGARRRSALGRIPELPSRSNTPNSRSSR